MTQQPDDRVAHPVAAAVVAGAAIETTAAPSLPHDELDPLRWELPVICKDCGQEFIVPYRHFKAGVVFHCPHCHGSFVPLLKMYHAVREVFETFYGRRRLAREEFARTAGDQARFERKQAAELEEFRKALTKLAHAMRPAGKMIKAKGFGAMFT
jgi:hypothetical protein